MSIIATGFWEINDKICFQSWDYLTESKYERECTESCDLKTDEYDDTMLLPSHSQVRTILRFIVIVCAFEKSFWHACLILQQEHCAKFG